MTLNLYYFIALSNKMIYYNWRDANPYNDLLQLSTHFKFGQDTFNCIKVLVNFPIYEIHSTEFVSKTTLLTLNARLMTAALRHDERYRIKTFSLKCRRESFPNNYFHVLFIDRRRAISLIESWSVEISAYNNAVSVV